MELGTSAGGLESFKKLNVVVNFNCFVIEKIIGVIKWLF